EGELLLTTLDAQIGELYWALYRIEAGVVTPVLSARVCKPQDCQVPGDGPLVALGSGLVHAEVLPEALRARILRRQPALLARARDLLPAAVAALERGNIQVADAVRPVYVRDEISWKKLSEQGKSI
ncbi:MAG: tRNA threonylcarbamoyladenosine biosynthesis protein TsaB, partial [Parahaliea sp.]